MVYPYICNAQSRNTVHKFDPFGMQDRVRSVRKLINTLEGKGEVKKEKDRGLTKPWMRPNKARESHKYEFKKERFLNACLT